MADGVAWASEIAAEQWASEIEDEWLAAETWAQELNDAFAQWQRDMIGTTVAEVGLPKALLLPNGPPRPITPGPLSGSKRQAYETMTGLKRRRGGWKFQNEKMKADTRNDSATSS